MVHYLTALTLLPHRSIKHHTNVFVFQWFYHGVLFIRGDMGCAVMASAVACLSQFVLQAHAMSQPSNADEVPSHGAQTDTLHCSKLHCSTLFCSCSFPAIHMLMELIPHSCLPSSVPCPPLVSQSPQHQIAALVAVMTHHNTVVDSVIVSLIGTGLYTPEDV